MIYVSQEQLDQVEYIIEQSSRGHHVLFDLDMIRGVFAESTAAEKGDAEVEKHIEQLILQPTLLSKKAYLERLDASLLKRLVRSYFSIVENNIYEGIKFHQ